MASGPHVQMGIPATRIYGWPQHLRGSVKSKSSKWMTSTLKICVQFWWEVGQHIPQTCLTSWLTNWRDCHRQDSFPAQEKHHALWYKYWLTWWVCPSNITGKSLPLGLSCIWGCIKWPVTGGPIMTEVGLTNRQLSNMTTLWMVYSCGLCWSCLECIWW